MAQTLVLTDDIDGSDKDVSTVVFSFEGASYEVDLTKKNRDAMEKALTPYLNAARKAGRSQAPARRRAASAAGKVDREWLRKNGFPTLKNGGALPLEAREVWENRK